MKQSFINELRELNAHSFKSTQKIFKRRLREIAANGETMAKYQPNEYACGDQIKPWLESLGFVCQEMADGTWIKVYWNEDEASK